MLSVELWMGLISTAFVLMLFSFTYKPNIWFTIAEQVLVGGLTGYATAMAVKQIWSQGFLLILRGQYHYILAVILGLMLFAIYVRKLAWWVRVPTAILAGVGIGLNMRAGIDTNITSQIIDTLKPIWTPDMFANFNNLLIMIGISCASLYFFYSREATGVLGPISKIGRYFLMVAFGCSFAYAAFSRLSILISSVTRVVSYPNYFMLIPALAVLAYDIFVKKKRSP